MDVKDGKNYFRLRGVPEGGAAAGSCGGQDGTEINDTHALCRAHPPGPPSKF